MPTIVKCIAHMKQFTGDPKLADSRTRIAGWSEFLLIDRVANPTFELKFQRWCMARGALLTANGVIQGQTYQQIDPPGPSISRNYEVIGKLNHDPDVPDMAILCTFYGSNAPNQRNIRFPGIPDNSIMLGRLVDLSAFDRQLSNIAKAQADGFMFQGVNKEAEKRKIHDITEAGVVTLKTPSTFIVGNMVRVLRTLDADRNRKGGLFRVSATANAGQTITLADWETKGFGACELGSLRLDGTVYVTFGPETPVVKRDARRKVGRPQDLYRGRVSRRR